MLGYEPHMKETKEKASVKIKAFPSSREKLKIMAVKNNVTMSVMLGMILKGEAYSK